MCSMLGSIGCGGAGEVKLNLRFLFLWPHTYYDKLGTIFIFGLFELVVVVFELN
ncbi:MAG: hypothetical protein CM15mV118_120 [uncultured marine virus]|nr:MAG: hypothetical protein CM15mV118_120 [uncultured marine virus]